MGARDFFGSLCWQNPNAHKNPPFRGGGFLGSFIRGGGSVNFILMGAGIFSIFSFCGVNFGGFCRAFSWRIVLGNLPTKMRRKNPATKSAKKTFPAQASAARHNSGSSTLSRAACEGLPPVAKCSPSLTAKCRCTSVQAMLVATHGNQSHHISHKRPSGHALQQPDVAGHYAFRHIGATGLPFCR